ncbi:MAG: LD-carboxypeptidase [Holosporaceae bacterium]|nr:LD-carboxypeptidase [Holosporaceae bacterium]
MLLQEKLRYAVSLIFVFFCCGCQSEKPLPTPSTMITGQEKFVATPWHSNTENDKMHSIYSRIGKLDMIGFTPGSGVYSHLKAEMEAMVCNYGINIPPVALKNKNFYRCADTEENRGESLRKAMESGHKILWAVRGGYGSGFIIELLNKLPVPREKKILIGFSDVTSLHLFVTQRWGWKAIHAPVLMHLCRSEFTNGRFDTLLDILEGKINKYSFGPVYPVNHAALRIGTVKGKLTGGNLTSLECSIGTSWEFQADNKIVFVEDIFVSPWQAYRSMHHLKEAGKFLKAKAILFGRFSKGGSQVEFAHYLKKFADSVGIPVFITNEFGHGNSNKPIIYGAEATICGKKIEIKVNN